MKTTTIAIIGFGRFGRLLTQILLDYTSIPIKIISSQKLQLIHPRLSQITLAEISQVDLVIPAVPISAFAAVMTQISVYLNPRATVIEVCSVKEYPVACMRKLLPASVNLISCHPMFGTETIKNNQGLVGLPIMLWSERCKPEIFNQIKQFCQKLKLKIQYMSPAQHDVIVARSQAYAFLIGKISQTMQLQTSPIDTWGYSILRQQAEIVSRNTSQLFLDIHSYNRHTSKMRQEFAQITQQLLKELNSKSILKDLE